MPSLFRIVGALWALLGVVNVVGSMDGSQTDQGLARMIVASGLLFALPGLVLIGIGELLSRRRKD